MLIYSSLSSSVFNSLYGFIKLHLIVDNALPNLFSSSVLIISINCSLLIGSCFLSSNLPIYSSLSSSVFNSLYGFIKLHLIFDNAVPNPSSSFDISSPFLHLGGIVVSFLFIHSFISLIFFKYAGILFLSIFSTIFIISSISGRLFLYFSLSSSVFNSLYGFIKFCLIVPNTIPNFLSSSGRSFPPPLGGIVVSFLSIHSFISYIFSKYEVLLSFSVIFSSISFTSLCISNILKFPIFFSSSPLSCLIFCTLSINSYMYSLLSMLFTRSNTIGVPSFPTDNALPNC